MQKNNKKNNEKGITLVVLVITIVILGLISIPTAINISNIIKVNDLTKYKDDLTNLTETVSQVYSQSDDISQIGPVYTGNIQNIPKNPNDNNVYYIINVDDLNNKLYNKTGTTMETLSHGGANYGIQPGDTAVAEDIYIINEQSRTIYYVKGFENSNGETIYSYPQNYTNIEVASYVAPELPTEMKNAANNETIYKTGSATGTVTPLSTTGTTTVKDNKNNEIKVPKNFGIAFDSGDNVADGIVIEDTNHNQYVWIPVGTITNSPGESKTIVLIRSNFNGTTTSNAETVIDDYYYEYNATSGSSYGNTKAKNISEFVSSANSNKGYYLARYEAGINASQDQYNYAGCSSFSSSMTYGDSSKMIAKDGSIKPLSKAGVGVWNAVTQIEAATICQAMYTKTSNGVESDLINSFAWDTAIDYIQKCGTASNSSTYATTQGKSTDTSNPQTTGTNTLSATSSTDQQCKIFDMAGNCSEWSTETYTKYSGSKTCGYRGGYYSYTNVTSYRYHGSTADRNEYRSFRPLLYM